MKSGDRYEILRELGRGAMADVFLARDRELDRKVALKVLKAEFAGHPGVVARMLREARTIASLSHPNILRLHDSGEKDGRPFLVIELLEGMTLEDTLLGEPVPQHRSIEIVQQIARAVHAAHQKGVIHRDLKPANIMIEPDGRVVVMDFGLAHLATADVHQTHSGAQLGTPYYMAPEQVRGEVKTLDGRTDVYAMGVILYELLTGKRPHEAPTTAALFRQILQDEIVPPRNHNPRIPIDLEIVCLRALAREPRRRYPDAAALADDLTRFLGGSQVSARRTLAIRRFSRNRKLPILVASVIAMLLVGFGTLWLVKRRAEAAAVDAKARQMKEMLETSETCLKAALELRRAGDLAGMKKHAAVLETVCRDMIARFPTLADPHFHWGRMLRAQMNYDKAFQQQEEALAKDPGHRDARYEHGLLLVRQYDDHITKLRMRWNRSQADFAQGVEGRTPVTEPPTQDLEDPKAKDLRKRAVADFEGSDGTIARAFRTFLTFQQGDAIPLFEQAYRETPETGESCEWLGLAARRAGKYEEGERWFTLGHRRDLGHIPLLIARGSLYFDWATHDFHRGQNPTDRITASIHDWEAVLRLDPGHVLGLTMLGQATSNLGLFQIIRGIDAESTLTQSIAAMERALAINAKLPDTLTILGMVYLNLGKHRSQRGGSPTEDWNTAIRHFSESIRIEPELAGGWEGRSMARANLGFMCTIRKEDPGNLFDLADEDCHEAIKLNPRNDYAWKNRANIILNWILAKVTLGRPCGDLYDRGIKAIDEAIRLNDQSYEFWSLRGDLVAAEVLNRQKMKTADAASMEVLYQQALKDYDKSIGINPKNGETVRRRGILHLLLEHYREALDDMIEALRLSPHLEPLVRPKITFCKSKLGAP